MNVLNAIKVAELRKKISAIPVKLILSAVLLLGFMLNKAGCFDMSRFSIRNFDFKGFFSEKFNPGSLIADIKADYMGYLAAFIAIYGLISYFTFFMQLLRQWFFGLVIGIGVTAVMLAFTGKYSMELMYLYIFVMLIWGTLFDVINFVRYKDLKRKVIKAEEEMKNAAPSDRYNDGFEEGYRRGIREGKRESGEDLGYGREKSDSEQAYAEIDDEEDYCPENDEYIAENGENSEDWDNSDDYEQEQEAVEADSGYIHGYFADCHSASEIKRRYHDLCKVYHPDCNNAGADIFCKINEEYKSLMNESDVS